MPALAELILETVRYFSPGIYARECAPEYVSIAEAGQRAHWIGYKVTYALPH
jgi:hypothetical protein